MTINNTKLDRARFKYSNRRRKSEESRMCVKYACYVSTHALLDKDLGLHRYSISGFYPKCSTLKPCTELTDGGRVIVSVKPSVHGKECHCLDIFGQLIILSDEQQGCSSDRMNC